MLTPSLSPSAIGQVSRPLPRPVAQNAFAEIAGHAGLIATEYTYKKDEEIYGGITSTNLDLGECSLIANSMNPNNAASNGASSAS